jgi:hypothetical protein
MIVVLLLILIFAIFRIVALAPVVMIHVFGSLIGFIFLPLCPPVLSALPSLLRPRHCSLSGIIVWVTLVAPSCLHCFIEVFQGLFRVESLDYCQSCRLGSRFNFPIPLVSQCLSVLLILFIHTFGGVQHLLYLRVVIGTISYIIISRIYISGASPHQDTTRQSQHMKHPSRAQPCLTPWSTFGRLGHPLSAHSSSGWHPTIAARPQTDWSKEIYPTQAYICSAIKRRNPSIICWSSAYLRDNFGSSSSKEWVCLH